jgi:hypothetical protein
MANHIEIDKENIEQWEYRGRPNPGAPRTPERDRRNHGAVLRGELSSAVTEINESRTNAGIDAENLLVLELAGASKPPDIDLLQTKFGVSIVEEVPCVDGTTKLVVQFPDRAAVNIFEQERGYWENDNPDNTDVLTYAQRRDLFACIDGIRSLTSTDRTGSRLSEAIENDTIPDGFFAVDIDVWYNGDITTKNRIEGNIRRSLGTEGSVLLGDLFVLPNVLLGRARVNRFTLEVLRKLDLIATVDFPLGIISEEQLELYQAAFTPFIDDTLDDNAPLACVIDSGVFTGNPLLSSVVVAEEDFDNTENTTADQNGHGTGVAGIVVYGDFEDYDSVNRVFRPLVRICNGKILHNDNGAAFRDDKRPEELVKEAIEYFHREYGCRIFNLSSGDADHIYNGGRQMVWASLLDELSRDLDVIIVVSAGNVVTPDLTDFANRNELMEQTRNRLLSTEHRLIDPATTALGITVGSITRYEEPETIQNRTTPLSVGLRDYPSAFTRTGQGVSGAIKPEFVDYGGNYAVYQMTATQTRWHKTNQALREPTLSHDINRVFAGNIGTSFSAPHVTHYAARIERALQEQTGELPSANLIRALLASSAKCLQKDWLSEATPPDFHGTQRQNQEWRLRLCGYGKVDNSTLFTDRNHVTLFAEDALDLKQIHLYKVPVPREFLDLNTSKRISVGFAYNPPTRLSRKAYIANTLWFEVFRRIDVETLLNYKGKKANADEQAADQIIEDFSQHYGAKFLPGYSEVNNSTLQQRVWEKTARGGGDLLWEDNDPFVYILVTGKAKFKHPDEAIAQPYALAITFSYESEVDIELRQKIREQARLKQREQVRVRTQVQL